MRRTLPSGRGASFIVARVNLLRHLRHFVITAEELHFSHAAEILGIAQPLLSQSIQRLERELGVTLFDRSRRQVELTAAGRVLLIEARELLAREQRLQNVMRRAREGALGTLRAGVPPETPALVLQALLRRHNEESPELEVDLHQLTTAEQIRSLGSADLDVGLVHHPIDAAGLESGPVVQVPLGVILPRLSPLARLAEIALDDLAGHDLVLFPRVTATGWYDRILETCGRHGFVPMRVRHAGNPEFLLGLVMAGQGIAFEQEAIARSQPQVTWRPLRNQPLKRMISAVWPAGSPHPAAPNFAAIAASVLVAETESVTLSTTPDGPRPWSVVFG
jgi:DNA-binding transcriptional LysR family regulator